MIEQLLTSGASIGGLVIALLVLNKAGVLDKFLKKNGNGKKVDEITKQATINEIETNHFGQVNEKLGEICDKLDKIYDCSKETNIIIKQERK